MDKQQLNNKNLTTEESIDNTEKSSNLIRSGNTIAKQQQQQWWYRRAGQHKVRNKNMENNVFWAAILDNKKMDIEQFILEDVLDIQQKT